jgi:hypothetical protein
MNKRSAASALLSRIGTFEPPVSSPSSHSKESDKHQPTYRAQEEPIPHRCRVSPRHFPRGGDNRDGHCVVHATPCMPAIVAIDCIRLLALLDHNLRPRRDPGVARGDFVVDARRRRTRWAAQATACVQRCRLVADGRIALCAAEAARNHAMSRRTRAMRALASYRPYYVSAFTQTRWSTKRHSEKRAPQDMRMHALEGQPGDGTKYKRTFVSLETIGSPSCGHSCPNRESSSH